MNDATGLMTSPPAAAGTIYYRLDDDEVPAAGRPPPLTEVRPQGKPERHTGVAYELVLALDAPLLQSVEVADGINDRATLQLLRALAVPPERVSERIVGTAPGSVSRRKRRKRRRKKLPKTSSPRSSSLTHSLATGLGKRSTGVRNNEDLWWVRPDDKMLVMPEYVSLAVRNNGDYWWVPPDGKTQVTTEHVQRVDETVERTYGDLWWLPSDGKKQVKIEYASVVRQRRRCSGKLLGKSSSRTDIWLCACTGYTMNKFIEEKAIRKFLGKPYSRTDSGALVCTVTARTCTSGSSSLIVLREMLA